MKKIYFLLVALIATSFSFGQTTGDLAFVGYNADGDDDFAIVALADIPANSTIYLSDNELDGAGSFVDLNEGELQWDTGGSIISAGTVVTFTDTDSGTNPSFGVSHGTLSYPGSGTVNLAGGGDALFVYLGTDQNTPTTFLAGIKNTAAGAEGDLTGSGLTLGSTFIEISTGGSPDGGEYTGPRNSQTTYAQYLALIANPANWTVNAGDGESLLPLDNTVFTLAAMATPTITVSGAVSGLDYFEGNGPSNEGTFTVSGINLTANINVAAPTNFEISTTSGSGFGASVMLTQSGGTVNTTTIYVRLAAGLTSNTYNGDVTASSTGATNQTVALSGTVNPAVPQMTIGGTVGALNYIFGAGPSAEDDFTVAGLFLTTDIVVTAPTNFEVSLTSGSGFASSVSVTPSSGTVATTTVYVRLAGGLAVNTYSGDITISSTGVANETISLNGEVYGPPTNALVLVGVYDGPLTGGTPKGIELRALANIPDLSKFGISTINDASGSTNGTPEYTFPADPVNAGDRIFLTTNGTQFDAFFTGSGYTATYVNGVVGINGDDSVELIENGVVIDTFGDVNMDGTGQPWEYLDGWAYRNDNTGPDGGFVIGNWTFSGVNQLEGDTVNTGTTNPYPIATYDNTVLSIADNKIDGFSIYPNPTEGDFITITTANNSPLSVEIFDLLGKKVITKNNVTSQVNIASLHTGIYVVKVTENNRSATKRLVVR